MTHVVHPRGSRHDRAPRTARAGACRWPSKTVMAPTWRSRPWLVGRGSVPLAGQPRPSPTALPVLAEGVPPFEQFGPPRQLVLEPAKRASSADGDTELVHLFTVVDCSDEQFHVAVPRAGTLALDPQPPLLIVVDVSGFLGVLDRRLRPHISGPKIDAPAAGDRVAFQRAGELLEVDRQRSQQRHRPGP